MDYFILRNSIISSKIPSLQKQYFDLFLQLKKPFFLIASEDWDFEKFYNDENNASISIIKKTQKNINIFKEADWPTIISFLKKNMIALDAFWTEYKIAFEMAI